MDNTFLLNDENLKELVRSESNYLEIDNYVLSKIQIKNDFLIFI